MGSIEEHIDTTNVESATKVGEAEQTLWRGSMSRRARLVQLIKESASGPEIARAFGVGKQRAYQLLEETGLHPEWKQSRRAGKNAQRNLSTERKAAQTSLLSLLKYQRRKRAAELGWPHEMTVRYFESMTHEYRAAQDYPTIRSLFEHYKIAHLKGKKFSLEVLGKYVGLPFVRVGEILRRTGIPSMNRKPTRFSTGEKATIRRGLMFGLSRHDVEYFLGRQGALSYNNRMRWGPPVRPTGLYWAPELKLNYHTASQIYEAAECGFTPAETGELFGVRQELANFALARREQYCPQVISALQSMFNAPEIQTPYITTAQRRDLVTRLNERILDAPFPSDAQSKLRSP